MPTVDKAFLSAIGGLPPPPIINPALPKYMNLRVKEKPPTPPGPTSYEYTTPKRKCDAIMPRSWRRPQKDV